MSRKRHTARPAAKIDWLEHRRGYPSPEEREAIIIRRNQLCLEFIGLVARDQLPDSPAGRRLVEKYGEEELGVILKQFDSAFQNNNVVETEAFGYRHYRQIYAQFGGARPFFSASEYKRLRAEHAKNFAALLKNQRIPNERQEELSDLLLMESELWEDLVPQDHPPRPAGFPQPGLAYQPPLTALLEYGAALVPAAVFARDLESWRKHTPALTSMALDPLLLDGWPADPASWGPWYALQLLGELGAVESAYSLSELADVETDWLSDLLPEIWAAMGPEVEPFLWMILEDSAHSTKKRGLAANALQLLADEEFVLRGKVVDAFGRLIANPATPSALNAYLVYFLGQLEAQGVLRPVIEAAFAENRIDTEIIEMEEMEWMEGDEDEWEDDEA